MGIHTMSTKNGGAGGGKQPHFQTLARQGSLYNLTLNEVQSQLGEPLSSMNLDELLRNVLPGELDRPMEVDLENPPPQLASSGLQRQGSISLTRTLSKKTVDEVWRDIQHGQGRGNGKCRLGGQETHLTLGEMTLEDFLVKAGVVAEDPERKMNDNVCSGGDNGIMVGASGYPHGGQWLQPYNQLHSFQQQPRQAQQSAVATMYAPGRPVPHQLGVGAGGMLEAAYCDAPLAISSPAMGALSDTQTPGHKRVAPGDMVEKTVERKQKRMIKNRESAARSRARKQAYTNELENKVSRLEEENERLKRQKEIERMLCDAPAPEPKFQLRRTSSAPF